MGTEKEVRKRFCIDLKRVLELRFGPHVAPKDVECIVDSVIDTYKMTGVKDEDVEEKFFKEKFFSTPLIYTSLYESLNKEYSLDISESTLVMAELYLLETLIKAGLAYLTALIGEIEVINRGDNLVVGDVLEIRVANVGGQFMIINLPKNTPQEGIFGLRETARKVVSEFATEEDDKSLINKFYGYMP